MEGRLRGAATGVPAGDLRAVVAAFRLGPVRRTRFLPEGLVSRNWQIITSRGAFALKQIADAPLFMARRNLRVVRALHAAGIPAFEPLLTVTGDTVAEAGGHGYCLSWWAEGQHLRRGGLPPAGPRHAGTVLARIHRGLNETGLRAGLAGGQRSPARAAADPDHALAAADRLLARIACLPEQQPWDLAAAESLQRRKDLLRAHAHDHPGASQPRGPSGWTHGDFHPLNLIWQDGQIAAVIDWNRIAPRTFAEEAVRSAALLFSGEDGQIDLAQISGFMAGYQALNPLNPATIADTVRWRWWKLLTDFRYFDEHYAQRNRSFDQLVEPDTRLLDWWSSHRQEVTAAFTSA